MRLLVAGAVVGILAAAPATTPPPPAWILYAVDQSGICAVRPDGSGNLRLTRGPHHDPTLSPDSSRIAVTTHKSGDYWNVDIFDPARRSLVASYSSGNYNSSPSWAPDAKRIAFASHYHGSAIYVAEVGKHDLQAIDGTPSGFFVGSPSWSPDGSAVVYVRATFETSTPTLTLAAPDGTNKRVLVRGAYSDPRWSPDGRKIVAVRRYYGPEQTEIFVVDVATTHVHRLTRTRADETGPAWSPDGSRIVFARETSARGATDLWTIGADGSNERRLTRTPHLSETDPEWRRFVPPAGRTCAVIGTPRADVIRGTSGGDIVYARGGNDRITTLKGDDVVIAGPGDDLVVGGRDYDRIFAGPGNDAVDTLDDEHDEVWGASGRDRARANRSDRLYDVELRTGLGHAR